MAVEVDALRAQMARIVELRQTLDEISALKKQTGDLVDAEERRMIELLQEADLSNFRDDKLGLVSISYRKSVQTPKTPEDRAAFFAYLKDRGLFDQMITVHSQTLNSFYKSEFEEAASEGKDDFKIPGIGEPTINPILSLRKA